MKIKTITCHDVYNFGASLQAYALMTYLINKGHDTEVINYKPDYLRRYYSFTYVANPKYDKIILRWVYILLKFPSRWKAYKSLKKRRFDEFTHSCLKTTKRFNSYEELLMDPPYADVYFAGSDQIWNPLFPNGKDPAFYLQFAPKKSIRASYAASFATNEICEPEFSIISEWLDTLDYISAREKSGIAILNKMHKRGVEVCDPVFLLKRCEWENISRTNILSNYCLLYDFDNSELSKAIIKSFEKKYRIISVFPNDFSDEILDDIGPREFLGAVLGSDVVISNSFHATAFSLIFHKDFFVIRRNENINTRMEDLLESVGLQDRLINNIDDISLCQRINWNYVDDCLDNQRIQSEQYIDQVIRNKN